MMSDTEQVDEEIDEDLIYQQMYQAIEDEIHVEFGSEETPNLDALHLSKDEIEVIRKQGIVAFKEIMLAKFRQNNENNDEEEAPHSPKSIQCEEGKHNGDIDESMKKGRDIEDGEIGIAENHGQDRNGNEIKNLSEIQAAPKTQVAEQTQPAIQNNIIPEMSSNNMETGQDLSKNARIPAGTLSDKVNAAGKINLKIGFALSLKTKFQKGETITENERLGKIPSEKVLKTPVITDGIKETSYNTKINMKDITITQELNSSSEGTMQKDKEKQKEITDQPCIVGVEQATTKILEDKNEANRDDSKTLNPLDNSQKTQQINDVDVHLKSEINNHSQEESAGIQREIEGNKEEKIVLEGNNNSSERNYDTSQKQNNKNLPQSEKVTISAVQKQSSGVVNGKGNGQTQEVETVTIAAAPADNYTSDNHGTNLPTTKSIPSNNQQSLITQVSFSAFNTNQTQSEQPQQKQNLESEKQFQKNNTIAVSSSNSREDAGRNGNANQGVERNKNTLTLKEKDIITPKKVEQLNGNNKSLKVREGGNSTEYNENSDKHGLVMWEGDNEVSPIKKQQKQYQLEESLNVSQPTYQQSQSANGPQRQSQQQQPQQPKKPSTSVLANNVRQLQLSGVKVSQMKMIAPIIGQQNNYDSELNRHLQEIQQASVDLSQGNQHLNEECLNLSNHISQLHASQVQNFSSPKSRGQNNNNNNNYSSSSSSHNRVCSPKQQEDAVASIYRRHQEAQDKIKKMKEEKDKREEVLMTKKAVYLSKTSEKILAKKQYVKLESRSTALAKSVSEKRKQQLEEKLKANEEAELQHCTFKPELISKSSNEEPFITLDEASQNQQLQQQYQSNGSNISNGSNNQRQYDEFFARQIAWTQRKRSEIMSNQIQQMEKEKSGLTFHPNINKISEEQVRNLRVEDRLLQDFERLLDKKKAMEEESQPLFRPVILPHSNQLAKQRKQRINMSNQLSNYNSTL